MCDPADTPDVEAGQECILLRDTLGQQYSIATRIDAIDTMPGEDPKIIVDKRILDQIFEGDKVEVIPWRLPEADKVVLAIPKKSRIFDGDWTPNVRQPLEGKVLDYMNTQSFMIPFETGPVILKGKVLYTSPKCPVKVGLHSKIFLKKFGEFQLDSEVQKAKAEKVKRTSQILEQMKLNSMEAIKALKSDTNAYQGDKAQFTDTEPKALFQALVQSFSTGYQKVEEPKEMPTMESFVGTAVFAKTSGASADFLFEIQVVGSNMNGTVTIGVYGHDTMEARTYLDQIYNKITDLQLGLQQRAEVSEAACQVCGATLPKEDADVEGYVKCQYCKAENRLPKRLRH